MVYQFTKESVELIRELRVKKNLNQEVIAKSIGTTKSYVSQVELGKKRLPKYRVLIKWLEALNVKPKYFEQLLTERVKSKSL